ncbi:MAG TPA: type II toxin-antitoxin system HicB family antitoxin [Roseimicrobium sp.]|nr:type II toxin-antitoxin system HicB family antitoxin [Roseimicrobium sp.]
MHGNHRIDRQENALYGDDMTLTAILTPDADGGFVALNPETGTSTQGDTIPEALANLKEATELYLEEFPTLPSGNPLLTTFEVAHA